MARIDMQLHQLGATDKYATYWILIVNKCGRIETVPIAEGCPWHIATSHERQLSCWIFHTSTGSKWHGVSIRHNELPTAKESLAEKKRITVKLTVANSHNRHIPVTRLKADRCQSQC
ncbi:MAG: hypothetical protein Q8O64_20825 [Sideroxyarcus sp.]|nr:hypothetical protein [Sideroxyarcus sp.]